MDQGRHILHLDLWTDQGGLELSSVGGELGWVLPAWQWSIVRYLLPHFEADHTNIWWPEPFGVCGNERCDLLLALPWTAELRLAQDCSELGAVPTSALLHDRLRTIDFSRFAAVSCTDSARVDAADAESLNTLLLVLVFFGFLIFKGHSSFLLTHIYKGILCCIMVYNGIILYIYIYIYKYT